MSFKKMSGFIDPITLGILIALGGSALGITTADSAAKPVAVSAVSSQAQTPAAASVTVVQAERTASK